MDSSRSMSSMFVLKTLLISANASCENVQNRSGTFYQQFEVLSDQYDHGGHDRAFSLAVEAVLSARQADSITE